MFTLDHNPPNLADLGADRVKKHQIGELDEILWVELRLGKLGGLGSELVSSGMNDDQPLSVSEQEWETFLSVLIPRGLSIARSACPMSSAVVGSPIYYHERVPNPWRYSVRQNFRPSFFSIRMNRQLIA